MVSSDAERPSPIGQTVGNYTILRKLSTGGMGTVYYAEHALIGRSAAIKVLHPELSGSKSIVNRFFNEAKATTSIKHPGIVEVFDYGYLPSGDGYLIMEFLEGQSLAHRLKKGGRYNEGEAAILLRGVCSALSAAHQKGIVHRDLKPDNIFLVDDSDAALGERPKVLDFGIAKLTDVGLAGEGTKTGAVMGTPTYMSPEQCKGTGNVDARADLYSLGCILYELVTGRPPFKNLGAGELIGAHQHLQPEMPSRYAPKVSTEMEQLILELLEKDPAKRVQSAPELARRLAAIAAKPSQIMPDIVPSSGTTTSAELTAVDPQPPAASSTELARDGEVMARDPTTLTQGAAQSIATTAHRPRSKAWKIAPVILAVAAAAGVVVLTMRSMQGSDEPDATVQPAASVPAAATTPPPPPPTVDPPPAPEVMTPPEPATGEVATPVEPVAAKPVKRPSKKPKPVKPPEPPAAKPPEPPAPKPKIGPIETDL